MPNDEKEKSIDLFSWFKTKFFTKDESDARFAPISHEHGDLYYTEDEVDTLLAGKAGLDTATTSSNGLMSSADKVKLNGIETEANKTIVDSSLSGSSENPVQNKVVKTALDNKVDVEAGKGLSTNDYTTAEKSKLAGIEEEANKTIVDASLNTSSENPVQNKVVKNALDGKANSSHSHSAVDVTDSNAYANLETSANASQQVINSAINTKVGAILNMEMIVVDSAGQDGKPTTTPSASTMNKLYLTKPTSGKDDNYAEFITIRSGSEGSYTYDWDKIGDISLDLSGYVRKEDVGLSLSSEGVLSITVE